jgi:DNA-binding SARP family transcriptional activator
MQSAGEEVSVEIALLGPFNVVVDGVGVPRVESRKAVELFAYLLLNRARVHHREVLAAALWTDTGASQARRYLRQSLWQLQSALEPLEEALGAPVLAIVDGDWVRISPDAKLVLDVDELEAIASGALSAEAGDDAAIPADLERACALYRGPLLEGRLEQWIDLERDRYQALYFAAVNLLMRREAAHGRFARAIELGHRSLRFDLAHEPTHRLLMQIHFRSGNRVTALRQYHCCARALEHELGAEPDAETQELYRRIRRAESEPAPAAAPGGSEELIADMRDKLRRVEAQIAELRRSFADE